MRSHICFKKLWFYKCHPSVQSVFFTFGLPEKGITSISWYRKQTTSSLNVVVWQCKMTFCWITTSQKLTKSFSIEASPESEWGITIRKKRYFFEERKIHLLFSAILMVALRGADCGIFCKLKHFFITAKLCRKERNISIYHEPWEHICFKTNKHKGRRLLR